MAQEELCLDGEEWRDIAGYEGYQASNFGRIRSLDRIGVDNIGREHFYHGRVIKHYGTSTYLVALSLHGNITSQHVDRLVATAFIENPDCYPDVLHIDGDTTNNRADNLAWGNHSTCYVFDHDCKESEEWRDVVGYDGLYSVSNLGRIKSNTVKIRINKNENESYIRTRKGRILKPILNPSGYPVVTLHDINGNAKTARVHRLVAQAFIDNPDNLPVVDHINAVRNDNRVENLRWVTDKENVHHAIEMGNLNPSKVTKEGLTDERIQHIREAASCPVIRDDGVVYSSQLEAGRALGYNHGLSVGRVVNGKQASCRGHTFRRI